MTEYIILKSCWLGKKDETVKLNPRQSTNLMAGGFINLMVDKAKKQVKK